MKVSKEGTVFKTNEGEMISDKYIEDTLLAMHSDFRFSIDEDSLVRDAMRFAGNGKRVILTYNEYKGTVLWRGDTEHVVTKIEPDSDRVKDNPYKNMQAPTEEKEK